MVDAERTSRVQQTTVVVIVVAVALTLTVGALGTTTGVTTLDILPGTDGLGPGETTGSDVIGANGTTVPEGTPAPTTPTPEPTTPTPAPATPTPEPTTPTPAPVTPTPEPTTSTPEPTTSTPPPATSTSDPPTSTPSSATSSTPEPVPETTLYLASGSDDVRPGKTKTYRVGVGSAHDGVGGAEMALVIGTPDVATITEVTVLGSGEEAIDIAEDGSRVDINYTGRDTYESGTVTILEVTVEGQSHGETSLSFGAANGSDELLLFDEEGASYDVTDTIGATITVKSGGGGAPESTPEPAPGEEEFTRDEISQAKYGYDFANLSTDTAGQVQAIYNRQPFSEETTPADIRTRDEITQDRYGMDFEEVSRETTIEIQNDYDAQFGSLPSDPAYTLDEIAQAKYGYDFANLSTETAGQVQAIYNRQPFPDGTTPADIRTRDEITQDRYGMDFEEVSRETTIEIQNDYDAQFTDEEIE